MAVKVASSVIQMRRPAETEAGLVALPCLAAQVLVFGREFAENLADGGAAQFDGVMFVGVLPQRSWNEYLGHGLFPSK